MTEQDIILPPVDPVPVESVQSLGAVFDGKAGALWRLCLKNAGVNLLTLFVYRFWAKTNLRRYFWGHTRIGDDCLEYTGRGIELFKGFVLAFGLVFGLSVAVALIKALIGMTENPEVAGLIEVLFSILLLSLWFTAIQRAWRYRLSRTMFRGVAFHLDGSTLRFVNIAWRYGILAVVTLGVAMPYRTIALTREIIGNTRYGTSGFAFPASGKDLLGAWIRHLGVVVGCLVVFGILMRHAAPIFAIVFTVIAVGAVAISYAYYRVKLVRYIAGRLEFEEARFVSGMRVGKVLRIVAKYLVANFVVLVVLVGIMGFTVGSALSAKLATGKETMVSGPDIVSILPVAGAFVLAFTLILPVLKTVVLEQGLFREFWGTLTISNPEAFDRVLEDPNAKEPSKGEGLASVFDIDAL